MGTIDDFVLADVLGEGGMARVVRAQHRRSGETVALKMILPGMVNDAMFIERFRREARAAERIAHPNICRVIDADDGAVSGRPFIAFELLDGGSVRDLKRAMQGRLPAAVAVEIVSQVLEGLTAAHAAGVVHRDLKPANLMLTRSGTVKIVDFGIARSVGDATLTEAGALVGTPSFLSPEQALGEEIDARSDLFTTGLILHELLTGRSPYFADTVAAMLTLLVSRDVPSLFESSVVVDPVVEGLHIGLTRRRREHRFQTAAEALAMIASTRAEVAARHPTLLASAVAEPLPTRLRLLREDGDHELERARTLLHAGAAPAALIALENAETLLSSAGGDVGPAVELRRAVRHQLGPPTMTRSDEVTHLERAIANNPQAPGPHKRLAEVRLAQQEPRAAVVALRDYLAVRKDPMALHQLTLLLLGPGGDRGVVERSLPLRTADIIAGIATAAPPSPAAARTRTPPPTPRGAVSVDGFGGAVSDDAGRGRAVGVFVGVVAACVVFVFVVRAITAAVVDANAATDASLNHHSVVVEQAEFDRQRTGLFAAEADLKQGNAVACARAVDGVLLGEQTNAVIADAHWLGAQCALLLRDTASATWHLSAFVASLSPRDARRGESATRQLLALQEHQTPDPVRALRLP